MTHFIIDLPYHKRYYLPDNVHMYNSVLFGDDIRLSVIDSRTHMPKESFVVKLSNPDWQDLCIGFQEKAAKKYPKQLRYKGPRR